MSLLYNEEFCNTTLQYVNNLLHRKRFEKLAYIYLAWFSLSVSKEHIYKYFEEIKSMMHPFKNHSNEHLYLYVEATKEKYGSYDFERSHLHGNVKWLVFAKPKNMSYIISDKENDLITSLFDMFELSYRVKVKQYWSYRYLEKHSQDYTKAMANKIDMCNIHMHVQAHKTENDVTMPVTEQIITYFSKTHINVQQSRLFETLKNSQVFVFGSTLLQLLHNEIYFGADIDLCCSIDNETQILEKIKETLNITMIQARSDPYPIAHKLYNGISRDYRSKFQLTVINKPYEQILQEFDKTVDLSQTAIRMYYSEGQLIIKGAHNMLSRNIDFNLNYIINRLMTTKGRISFYKTRARVKKYISRRFSVDVTCFRQIFEHSDISACCICMQETFDYEFYYRTACNHLYHLNCIETWTHYEPGDRIVPTKSCCPCCVTPFTRHTRTILDGETINFVDVSGFDFARIIPIYCLICNNVFISDEEPGCNVPENIRVVCNHCMALQGMPRVDGLTGRFLNCPHCGIDLQHGGGCAHFVCCRFGTDGCRGSVCDVRATEDDPTLCARHGSTSNVTFCGWSWIIQE